MFKKILVANRGEIAVRVIRTCREMGIKTVAIYSEADKESMHRYLADESVCIGPAQPLKSYLNIPAIIEAAKATACDALHPGFGFLSENAEFARLCDEKGIKFIGPTGEHIEKMGNKSYARKIMIENRVPVVPGSDGIVNDAKKGLKVAREIGYPVIIKASSGGGGKGMRIANDDDEFDKYFIMCQAEAKSSFNDASVYVEKYVLSPKHIEFQILADSYGNIVYLGERDCSIQRKHQKMIEEAPSVTLNENLRKYMGEAAISAARAVGYVNAGTIEFLVDKDNNFYFMEMNTRIQVEHPVTEYVTGIDIVKEQIRVASGQKLSLCQKDIKLQGHSIECRINAEDVKADFRPCPGTIISYHAPGGFGVRVDSSAYEGYTIPPFYDSMIAKLIVWGTDRNDAINRMKRALGEFIIDGVDTNIEFQLQILNSKDFVEGKFDTSFISNFNA
ncbi:biotin carboxylase [Oxobacter pfennigii]|uniref:Biotin carboxylase n=1 Tax=Oxobacter pfennigii TaxID=36849 RepID=A0A0P8YSL4_9CLOT|nr:acetyl-CoA carboxylase biotin carboxylase subunit [Oxobacter pfennigii]KPU42670.1 biotin carboxylase [Oxobacter pfennigii]